MIEYRPLGMNKISSEQYGDYYFICSLVYVYIWFIQYQPCKNRCANSCFPSVSFYPCVFLCLAPSLRFWTFLFSHRTESSSLCTCMHTTHTIRVEAPLNIHIYQDICDESINLVQLPFGNHPDTKQFFALHISYT